MRVSIRPVSVCLLNVAETDIFLMVLNIIDVGIHIFTGNECQQMFLCVCMVGGICEHP